MKQKEYHLKSLSDIVTLDIMEIQTEGLTFEVIRKEVILKTCKDLSTNRK